jgi:YD repeat-containing protein
MTKTIPIVAALLAVLATDASAQSRTYYDSSGKSIGRSTTDSQGSTTFFDASGKVTGRSWPQCRTVHQPLGASAHRVLNVRFAPKATELLRRRAMKRWARGLNRSRGRGWRGSRNYQQQ